MKNEITCGEIKYFVEDCENWMRISTIRGRNCFNCAKRNGYPDRGQPDKKCKNFGCKYAEKREVGDVQKTT